MLPVGRPLPPVELLTDVRAQLGEGPVWDARSGRLVWINIEGRRLHQTDPDTGATTNLELPLRVGVCVPRASGGFLAALEDGFYSISQDGLVEQLVAVETASEGLRFNDGACDPQGRFWAGTMSLDGRSGTAALYRLGTDLRLAHVLEGVTVSNGIGWSPDRATMYYVDTATKRLDAFDFEAVTGTLGERRSLVEFPGPGQPDGLCVDAEGGVWVAVWGGWSVHRYLPDGTLDAVAELPVAQVSSCAFGGPELDQLFITTAWDGLSPAEREAQPLAGGLFRVDAGVHGLQVTPFGG